MSRFSKAERRDRRQAREKLALLGREWLAIRESGAFLADGYASWKEYRDRAIAPTIPAAWQFTSEQTERFIAKALRLAEIHRRHGKRATRCR